MKRIALLSLGAMALLACSDAPPTAPQSGPSAQLVSGGMDRDDANIEIVATFTHTINGLGSAYRTPGTPGINDEGKEIGTCLEGGAWKNPAGKVTGARPHSHCLSVSRELTISLEMIDGEHETFCHASCGNENRRVADKVTFDAAGAMFVTYNKSSGNTSNWYMQAQGVIIAHAVDQDGNRHGTFTFDLAQFAGTNGSPNLFDEYTNIGTELEPIYVWGLDKEIAATYTDPDGAETTVMGYVYWSEIEE